MTNEKRIPMETAVAALCAELPAFKGVLKGSPDKFTCIDLVPPRGNFHFPEELFDLLNEELKRVGLKAFAEALDRHNPYAKRIADVLRLSLEEGGTLELVPLHDSHISTAFPKDSPELLNATLDGLTLQPVNIESQPHYQGPNHAGHCSVPTALTCYPAGRRKKTESNGLFKKAWVTLHFKWIEGLEPRDSRYFHASIAWVGLRPANKNLEVGERQDKNNSKRA